MLDDKGFDLWADGYDKSVGISDDDGSYPFAGYREILARIYRRVLQKPKASVLDIGFGTAALTAKLYEQGCTVYGQDFSARMIELARAKMPEAFLCQGDFALGLVAPLTELSYDFIIATYALHHLTDAQKITFLHALRDRLNTGGMILIGDVAFETRDQLETCRLEAGDAWDDEEFYFVADELRKAFPDLTFEQISHCAGIISLKRGEP